MLREFDSQVVTALELRAALATVGPKHGDESLPGASTAGEFITTRNSHLTRCHATILRRSAANLSPAPQEFGPNGELMRREMVARETSHELTALPQMLEHLVIATSRQTAREASHRQHGARIFHHAKRMPGEKSEPR